MYILLNVTSHPNDVLPIAGSECICLLHSFVFVVHQIDPPLLFAETLVILCFPSTVGQDVTVFDCAKFLSRILR